MTGFGKSAEEICGKKVAVEFRSLNSKSLDLSIRMPYMYKEREAELRSEIAKQVERGKVEFVIYVESGSVSTASVLNVLLAKQYHKELQALSDELNQKSDDLLSLVLKMPDVVKSDKETHTPDEKEWKQLKITIAKAMFAFQSFRTDEGKSLGKEIKLRIEIIAKLLKEIGEKDALRIKNIRNRIKKNMDELIPTDKIDKNRFEQELIYYIEKLDITEEKLRLKTHLDYFLKTMKENSSGRKLGFIAQEIGREINTIGSKANNADIQKIVVQMKDELEKIKEQLLNVL